MSQTTPTTDATLYRNTDTLGSTTYIATREEWEAELREYLVGCYREDQLTADPDADDVTEEAYIEWALDQGLIEADAEDVARYQRLVTPPAAGDYVATLTDDSGTETETIRATSDDEAIALATAWAEELLGAAEYGPGGGTSSGRLTVMQDDRRVYADGVDVEIAADEDELIRQAGGDPRCAHDWQPGEGGLDENPGVWGIGGAAILSRERCARCGVIRDTIHGDVDAPNRNGVTYHAADGRESEE